MAIELLDVAALPTTATDPVTSLDLDVNSLTHGLYNTVRTLGLEGLVKVNSSFGFAVARLDLNLVNPPWDDPKQFVWFVGGWGPDRQRYIANAVRKLRALMRENRDTLEIRIDGDEDAFRKPVASSEPDGTFAWGDFPWGGAGLVPVGDLVIPTAVSALREVEDHALLLLIAGLVGAQLLKLRNPKEWAR